MRCGGPKVQDGGGVGRHVRYHRVWCWETREMCWYRGTTECKHRIKKNLCLDASGENDWTEFTVKCKLHMERFMKYRQINIVKLIKT